MATTAAQIITEALAMSTKNNPGKLAADAELLRVLNRVLSAAFSVGARLNPVYFATTAPIAFAGGQWTRPVAAESVFRIEMPDGAEVAVVPYDDRRAEMALPAVYQLGLGYLPAGNGRGPVDETLTFYYARRPAALAALTDTLDPVWPEAHNSLLSLSVAYYLAMKDGRSEELGALSAEQAAEAQRYAFFLGHETANERRRLGVVRRIVSRELIPLAELFGGSSLSSKAAG